MQMLREISDLCPMSYWPEVRKRIEWDSRYRAVESSHYREEWFKEFCMSLPDNSDDDSERRVRDRQERIEASLREREKEVQQTLSVSLRERNKEREQHLKEEAIQHFKALLADMVRNGDKSWKDTRRELHKDQRYKLAKLIDKSEKEKLYEEHVMTLCKKSREMFHRLLDETPEVTLTSEWRNVRKLIKNDPRYTKFSSSEKRREKEFTEYLQAKLFQAKTEFRVLLQETKIITFKSGKLVKESDQHLKDIMAALQKDRRCLVLQCCEAERKKMVLDYMQEVEWRGPPPPPTASEPSRRGTKQ